MLYFLKLAIDSLKTLINTPVFMGYGFQLKPVNVIVFACVVVIIKKIFDALAGE